HHLPRSLIRDARKNARPEPGFFVSICRRHPPCTLSTDSKTPGKLVARRSGSPQKKCALSGGFDTGFEVKNQLALPHVDVNHATMFGQLPKEDLLCQWPLDLVLDQPCHWPSTHLHVVAALGQPATSCVRDLKRDVLVLQLRLQLNEELIDDALDHFVTQATKLDNGIQTVSEFRRKALLDHFHRIGRVVLMRKANRSSCCRFRSGISGHDQNDVAEIRLAPV